jgi:two-component system nitrogen regulation response regulator GlnG
MPGLSGLDLLRAVKVKQPATPVVLMTGVPSLNSAVFGLRYGAYDYLPKPFSVKEVQQLVRRLRTDRQSRHGGAGQPAGLMEELARRQTGMEGLFRIGELALQGLDRVSGLSGSALASGSASRPPDGPSWGYAGFQRIGLRK